MAWEASATTVLSTLGYEVHAITGRESEHARLKQLGATEILARADFARDPKPLESTRGSQVPSIPQVARSLRP